MYYRILTNLTREGSLSIVSFLWRRFLFAHRPKLTKLLGQKILNAELVFVRKVRDVHCGAARADPVGADRTGIPGGEPSHHLLLIAGRLGAALDVGGHVLGDVEVHHVVAL